MKETLVQHWRAITVTLIALALAVIGGISSGILTGKGNDNAALLTTPPLYPTRTPGPPVSHAIKVYITGAVLHPDVYPMRDSDRIADLLDKAGGPLTDKSGTVLADLSTLNLAEPLRDGQRVDVPFKLLPNPTTVSACPSPPTPVAAIPTTSTIKVYVSGAVCSVGIYALHKGDRVGDAISAAGGASPDADLSHINLAAFVSDGQQIAVPFKGSVASGGSQSAPVSAPAATVAPSAPAGPVNINTATAAELDKALPGIGPTLAQRIVDYRTAHGPFQRIEDLMKVTGIGLKEFDKIKGLVTV